MKRKTIDSYFQKQKPTPKINDDVNFDDPNETTNNVIPDNPTQIPNQQPNSSDTSFVRKPISSYPSGIQREIVEYSPTTDAAYCFPCFLSDKKPLGKVGSDTFTVQGFRNLVEKIVHLYPIWEETLIQLMVILFNVGRIFRKLKLTFQKCAFRRHVENADSKNQGNFLEMLKLIASYNKDVQDVVLANAPQNAKYIAPSIQKQILHVFAKKVQNEIRKEIGDSKFCIIIDESRDVSKREEMAIVIRFVNKYVLSNHELKIKDLKGQGYDGASNMRGEWNGLQALFIDDCAYVYYVHCLAHQLQLSLIVAAREVFEVYDFIKDLIFIVNVVSSSSKRHDELQDSRVAELEHLIEIEEVDTGKGMNQIDLLCRALQQKSQDILHAMDLLVDTKCSIQDLKDEGWKDLLDKVLYSFCNRHGTLVPDMQASYSDLIRARRNKDNISMEHHYKIDVFTATMDQQLQELNSRFSEKRTELLVLSASLNPNKGYKNFNVDNICRLEEKCYPAKFSKDDQFHLRYQLQLFYRCVFNHDETKNLSSITDLCQTLAEIGKSNVYPLVDRLIRLILTLPVSTTTSERAFSAMKIVNTSLRNKMDDDFLWEYLIVYIEKDIAEKFTIDSIIDDFNSMKTRRVRPIWMTRIFCIK
ncbi:uncharacterized protein LOC104884256 [Beta vulgaris subsp. vulgaris]|uniref:uncharacterized protein LOC104884256 n=1 Tax=Beta vulgaris subsp. vulgaris TaxID=3555 RepID=UPI00053F7EC6|nr:uncharacterized protein LOC104884256 [Beta vulgaris subsp. vulgaris]